MIRTMNPCYRIEERLTANLVRRCGLDELDEHECLRCAVATVHLAGELGERVVGAHADSNRATVEVGLTGAVDVEAQFAVLLLCQIAEVTDTDVAGGFLGGNAGALIA